jgi:hypothetical protein
MPTKTQRERDDDARKQKLELIEEQVKAGTLVIRQMTAKERAAFERKQAESPAQPTRQRRKRARGGPER